MRRPLLHLLDLLVVLATIGLFAGGWFILEQISPEAPVWASFAGRFHIVLLHFPVGVLILLAVVEMLATAKAKAPVPIVFLFFAALTTYTAAAAGLLLAWEGGYNEQLLFLHLIGGVLTAFFAGAALLLRLRVNEETGSLRVPYRISLWAAALAAGAAGHFGGSITHGEAFLTELAGEALSSLQGSGPAESLPESPTVYAEVIVPILEARCYSCHNESKKKHGLALDSVAAMLAGGNLGPALVPGDASASSMAVNITLPLDDEYHMPPAGKEQVTEEELANLRWWIDAGASETLRLDEAELPFAPAIAGETPPEDAPAQTEPVVEEPVLTLRESIELMRIEIEAVFPGALTWVAEDTDALSFTAVSYRETFGDEELARLAEVAPYLLSVNLSATQVTDAGLDEFLTNMTLLEQLDLSNTATNGKPIFNLPPSAPLRILNLFNTRVDDGTAIILGQQKGLERLYLGQTNVGLTVLEGLRTALPNCEVVGEYTAAADTPKAAAPAEDTSDAATPVEEIPAGDTPAKEE